MKKLPTPMPIKHKNLIEEFEEIMLRVKIHLLAKEGGLIDIKKAEKFKKPTARELNLIVHNVIDALKEKKDCSCNVKKCSDNCHCSLGN